MTKAAPGAHEPVFGADHDDRHHSCARVQPCAHIVGVWMTDVLEYLQGVPPGPLGGLEIADSLVGFAQVSEDFCARQHGSRAYTGKHPECFPVTRDGGGGLAAKCVHKAEHVPGVGLAFWVANLAAQLQRLLAGVNGQLEIAQASVVVTEASQGFCLMVSVAQLAVQDKSLLGVT